MYKEKSPRLGHYDVVRHRQFWAKEALMSQPITINVMHFRRHFAVPSVIHLLTAELATLTIGK
jgi:hypothetical protein